MFLNTSALSSAINSDSDIEKQVNLMWSVIDTYEHKGDNAQILRQLIAIDSFIAIHELPGILRSRLVNKIYSYNLDIQTIESQNGINDFDLSKAYLFDGLRLIFFEGDFENSELQLLKSIEKGQHYREVHVAYRWLGLLAAMKEKTKLAEQYLNNSLVSATKMFREKSILRYDFLVSVHITLATLHTNKGNIKSAKYHAGEASKYAILSKDDLSIVNAQLTEITAILFHGDPEELLHKLSTLEIKIKNAPDNSKSQYYNLLGESLNRDGQYKAAIKATKQAIKYSIYDNSIRINEQKIAESYHKLGDYKESIPRLNDLITFYTENPGYTSSLSEAYFTKAQSLKGKGDVKAAMNSLQKAIDLKGEFEHWRINHLSLLAPLYMDLYEQTKEQQFIDSARISMLKTDSIINFLRTERRYFEDEIDLGQRAYDTYASNLETLSSISDINTEVVEDDLLFKYIEGLKSFSLKELLKTDDAVQIGAIPEEILNTERMHKFALTQIEKRIYQDKSNGVNENSYKDWQIERDSLKNVYYKFLVKLESDCPEYYRHQYKDELIRLTELQRLLSKEEAIIEYFISEKQLYTLIIEHDKVHFEKRRLPVDWNQKIQHFKTMLIDTDTSVDLFQPLSFELYQLIIEKPFAIIGPQVTNLRIVSDDVLNFIPFETLISSINETSKSFKDLYYIGKPYTLSYGHSSTFIAQAIADTKKRISTYQYIGYAPSYQNETTRIVDDLSDDVTRGSYQDLPFARKNVANVSSMFQGKAFLKEQANIKNFHAYATKSKIIHLAMHGIVDLNNPTFSRILFHGDEDNNSLYINDIYGMSLNADLVVLGACNTGVGELVSGDGIQNMSRAFHFAGAKNTIMSLWSVPDIQTAQLTYSFFEEINQGERIDEALKSAKLLYLAESNELRAHPYYWAGLVAHGSMAPINLDSHLSQNWVYYGLLIVLILIILFLYIRNVISQTRN